MVCIILIRCNYQHILLQDCVARMQTALIQIEFVYQVFVRVKRALRFTMETVHKVCLLVCCIDIGTNRSSAKTYPSLSWF